MANKKIKVGVIGCGNISGAYLSVSKKFHILEMYACADAIPERAKEKAKEFNIPKAYTVKELLNDPEIKIVVNLTIPKAHGEIGIEALKSGKCVYNEKPLALNRDEGMKMLKLAKEKKLLVGSAPDTFLGGGIQTCRKLIDDGWIGKPVAATAFMMGSGPESWHPDPEFFYKPGAGPMFDMGPYYVTALVNLISPVKKVTSFAKATFSERTITSQQKYGQKIKVETPTHIAGLMEFKSGAIGTIIMTFDVYGSNLPRIEVYGSEGTLVVPDPNSFGGPVFVRRKEVCEFKEVPLTHGYSEQNRSIGVADMAYALVSGRQHRANGNLAYHVLDVMQSFLDSAKENKEIEIASTCEQPKPLPLGLPQGTLDE
jgi:predicted dehydrogenase